MNSAPDNTTPNQVTNGDLACAVAVAVIISIAATLFMFEPKQNKTEAALKVTREHMSGWVEGWKACVDTYGLRNSAQFGGYITNSLGVSIGDGVEPIPTNSRP